MQGPAEPVVREAPPLRGRVISTQSWRDVTFLHWTVDPARVAPLLPPGTRPDLFEDRTYVGLVPFRMVDVTLGRGPALPYVGSFLETNVRVYSVDETGRRGVVFLSLDAERAVVVPTVRLLVGPPYRWARMRFDRSGDTLTYETRVRGLGERPASRVVVRLGEPYVATPLDDFLTARWGAHDAGADGAPCSSPTSTRRGSCSTPRWSSWTTDCWPRSGLPGVSSRPPDRVAFSHGVYAEFARPRSRAGGARSRGRR